MDQPAVYRLIGYPLGHSMSVPIHQMLGDYDYRLMPLEWPQVEELLAGHQFGGLNVTIPYKQKVMELCDHLDPRAKEIGAVNTLIHRDGELWGYNTDFDGLVYLLSSHQITLKGKRVMILGTGGTSHTARAVAKYLEAREIVLVGRTPREDVLSYQQAALQKETQVILNTSPAGMYPNNGECLISPEDFPCLEGVVDVVYNPLRTELMLRAMELGIPVAGGLAMLVAQACAASQLFTGQPAPWDRVSGIVREMERRMENLVLIGMPGCGKTTVGRELAELTGKTFVDMDEAIVERAGCSIPEIFAERGEAGFRQLEEEVCRELSCRTGTVLATGGGVVTRQQNIRNLRQNGRIFYLRRPLDQLSREGRPLSAGPQAVEKIYEQRQGLYKGYSEVVFDNVLSPSQVASKIMEWWKR